MSYSALENTPIQVNLLVAANDTGWSVPGDGTAVHSSCNGGYITLESYPVKTGQEYQVSFIVQSISGGGEVELVAPGATIVPRTTAGLYVENITPLSDGNLQFYSDANCVIAFFNVKPVSSNPGTTIVYSATNSAKRGMAIWSDTRTFYPDFGWSLYTRTIVANNGALWAFDNGDQSGSTNNFFGTQFQSSIKFVEAKDPQIVKDFEALTYQANQLLITTEDGVQTSLGQISTLIDTDFIKQKLQDGGLEVISYQNDGVYSASFLGDENDNGGITNGVGLRGSFIIIELITFNGSTPLTLFSISVRSKPVFLGSRPL